MNVDQFTNAAGVRSWFVVARRNNSSSLRDDKPLTLCSVSIVKSIAPLPVTLNAPLLILLMELLTLLGLGVTPWVGCVYVCVSERVRIEVLSCYRRMEEDVMDQ